MQKRIVTVRNRAGIHCRPSGVILTAIKNEFPDHFFQVITDDGEVTELDSMLALISLGLVLVASLILVLLAGKIYRMLILYKGKTLKMGDVIRMLRSDR